MRQIISCLLLAGCLAFALPTYAQQIIDYNGYLIIGLGRSKFYRHQNTSIN